jgi:hypothetical protein
MVFYHNNADANQNHLDPQNAVMFRAVAKSFFPKTLAAGETGVIRAELMARNAATVWDEAEIVSNEAVSLEFIDGSSKLFNASTRMSSPAGSGRALPQSFFTDTGTLIGWHNLDGVLPGGEAYAGYIRYVLSAKVAKD